MGPGAVIGVDFDNTIVSYDEVMHRVALERGLIAPNVGKSKKQVRDRIRRLPDGEIEWQRLQAVVYGSRSEEGTLADGADGFFRLCRQHGVRVCVVSHKTEYARFDETGSNLREAALRWMARRGFFDPYGLGLSREDVYFESTRRGKIERIARLGCRCFIDDLEEIFLEESFPPGVERILYGPHGDGAAAGVRVFRTWGEISSYLFRWA